MNKQSDSAIFLSAIFLSAFSVSLMPKKRSKSHSFLFLSSHSHLHRSAWKIFLSLILCVRGRDDKSLSMQLGFWSSFNSMGFLPSLWPQAFKDAKALGLMTKSNTISVTHETKLAFLFAAPNVCFPFTCEAHPESSYAEIFPCSTFTTQHLLTAY